MRRALSVLLASAAVLLAMPVVASAVVPAINPWRVVSERSGKNLDESSAVRAANGTLHVVYTDDASVSSEAIRYRTLSPGGTWSAPETVVAGWIGVTNPDIELVAGVPHVFWAGQRSTESTDPASSGQAWYASRAGGTWTLSATPFSNHAYAYATSQMSTALASDGTPWGVWTGNGLRVHAGLATGGSEEPSLSGGCCDYAANLGRDTATGDLYTTYYSNADGGVGYFTQRIAPSLGDRVLLPGGRFQGDALSRGHRLAAASRTTGGVYSAYCDAYPGCTSVRVGAVTGPNLRLKLPSSSTNAETVWTASAPFGRMWVTWADSKGVWAVRSNRALTMWGAKQVLRGPRNFDTVWQTSGEASRGPLDLFANINVGDDYRIWHQRVRPKLSLTPSVQRARNNIARVVRMRLTDAGDPISGTVRFRGMSDATDALGWAQFVVPAGTRTGRYVATGTATGYVPGAATVLVTR